MVLTIAALFTLFTSPPAAAGDRPVRIQITVDPGSLDPNHLESLVGTTIAYNLYEPLMRPGASGKPIPALAEKYEISKNRKTYKFKLRAEAKWSDGKSVTIEDCIFGILDALDPRNGNEESALLFPIKNAAEFYKGKAKRNEVGVRRSGEWLVITLKEPESDFLGILSEAFTSPKRPDQKGHFPTPTNGYYVIRSLKPGVEIDLEPNPYHREPGQLPIEYKILSEEVTGINLFDAGKLDLLTVILPTEVGRLEKKGVIMRAPIAATNFLAFNLAKPPFDQLVWRKAIASAIERSGLEKVLNGLGRPTSSLLPSTVVGYLPMEVHFGAEQERIRQMSDKPKIHIGFASSVTAQLVLEKVQSDLHRNLGIDVLLDGMEQKVYFSELGHNAPPIYFLGNASSDGDPEYHLHHFVDDPIEHNHSHYHSEKYEGLVRKIRQIPNGETRDDLIHQALRVLMAEDVVVIPLYERQQIFALDPRLRGFQVNPASEIELHRLRWAN